jgi:hypothetical protein
MKNLLKELGKYFFDVSKIILAVAVITPFVKSTSISIGALMFSFTLLLIGAYLTYKGDKDE